MLRRRKVKAAGDNTPFHQKPVAKRGETNLSNNYKNVCFSVQIAATAANPWRGSGDEDDDGAAVPVSGVCASAA